MLRDVVVPKFMRNGEPLTRGAERVAVVGVAENHPYALLETEHPVELANSIVAADELYLLRIANPHRRNPSATGIFRGNILAQFENLHLTRTL